MEIACFLGQFPTFRIYGTDGHLGVDLYAAQRLVQELPQPQAAGNALVRRLDLTGPRRKKLRSRLAKQLAKAPDVLALQQICDITGYNRHTVSRWRTEGRLRTIQRHILKV